MKSGQKKGYSSNQNLTARMDAARRRTQEAQQIQRTPAGAAVHPPMFRLLARGTHPTYGR